MRRLMQGVTLVGVFLAALPAVAEKPRVVVLDFSSSSDKLKRAASSVAEQMLTELSRPKTVEVLGTSDVTALLGMERQRELLGCGESNTTCLAEITAAMGAPWLVMGNLAQLGKVTRIDLKLIRATDGKAVLREGKNLSDESEIFDFVNSIVPRMLAVMEVKDAMPTKVEAKVEAKPETKVEPKPVEPKPAEPVEPVTAAPPAAVATTQASPGAPVAPWIVVGAGALVAIGGGVLFAIAFASRAFITDALRLPDPLPAGNNVPTYGVAKSQLTQLNNIMLISGLAAGVGLAGVAGGLIWRFKGPSGVATVSLAPGPASLVVQGAF